MVRNMQIQKADKEGSRDYAGTDTERHYWVVKLSREEKELAQGNRYRDTIFWPSYLEEKKEAQKIPVNYQQNPKDDR
ncbi:hypothetical protein Bca52824_013842 [Brassica carinata]|uniref:Uncharacterized protein n=1 Tax=Brassica carinata TaxID=52824 RepID=A0A8X7VZX0_BRACI|nr:hypothetical protein Bca52824_013842 [Brassica carinata]